MDIKIWDREIPFFDEGTDTPNRISLHLIECKEKLPCVMVFPGGGYSRRADYEGDPVAEYFNGQGFHACVVHYRTGARVPYPAPLIDAQRAVKLLRANADVWEIDADRIFTLGFSAGAHLASYASITEDIAAIYGDAPDAFDHRANGIILSYPMLQSENGAANGVHGCFTRILPKKGNLTEEDLEPIHHLHENVPPHFIWHTAKDGLCTPSAALAYAARLCELNVNVELHLFPGGGHGGALRTESPVISKWAALATDFIHRNGLPK